MPNYEERKRILALGGLAQDDSFVASTRGRVAPQKSMTESIQMTITIYHNPKCGTSRNTLEMIRKSGVQPTVIEYLKTPPSREELVDLIKRMGIPARDVLRQKGTPYDELELGDDKWSDDQLFDFMIEHPILMNRPIVVSDKGVRLCRPSEEVLDLLPSDIGTFTKEDGEVVSSND